MASKPVATSKPGCLEAVRPSEGPACPGDAPALEQGEKRGHAQAALQEPRPHGGTQLRHRLGCQHEAAAQAPTGTSCVGRALRVSTSRLQPSTTPGPEPGTGPHLPSGEKETLCTEPLKWKWWSTDLQTRLTSSAFPPGERERPLGPPDMRLKCREFCVFPRSAPGLQKHVPAQEASPALLPRAHGQGGCPGTSTLGTHTLTRAQL